MRRSGLLCSSWIFHRVVVNHCDRPSATSFSLLILILQRRLVNFTVIDWCSRSSGSAGCTSAVEVESREVRRFARYRLKDAITLRVDLTEPDDRSELSVLEAVSYCCEWIEELRLISQDVLLLKDFPLAVVAVSLTFSIFAQYPPLVTTYTYWQATNWYRLILLGSSALKSSCSYQ